MVNLRIGIYVIFKGGYDLGCTLEWSFMFLVTHVLKRMVRLSCMEPTTEQGRIIWNMTAAPNVLRES